MYRVESTERPLSIQRLNDGTYYYNYDIVEKLVSTELGEETRYDFIQVCLRGLPSYDKCVQAIIRSYVSESEELALINKYAAQQFSFLEEDTKYQDYLQLVEEIKYKVKLDFNLVSEQDMLQECIKELKIKIINYDKSEEVNSFTVNGLKMWLNKETRSGLKLRIESELALGKKETTLWYEGQSFTIPLEQAMQMLYSLEIYASQCYDVTQQHLANASKITSISETYLYDYKANYPDKLVF